MIMILLSCWDGECYDVVVQDYWHTIYKLLTVLILCHRPGQKTTCRISDEERRMQRSLPQSWPQAS